MTPADLETLLREAEEHDRKATPGPWVKCCHGQELATGGDTWWSVNVGQPTKRVMMATAKQVARFLSLARGADDAAFVSWSRSAVPQLIAAIRDLQAREQRTREALAMARNHLIGAWDPTDGRDGVVRRIEAALAAPREER